jgi:hypothetical protein
MLYRDPENADEFEKIIVNLCLKQCSMETIQEMLQFSKEHILTTALYHLNMADYNEKSEYECTYAIEDIRVQLM